MIHQLSTSSTVSDEYVLNCTCGVQFIGTAEAVLRNMTYHQDEVRAAPSQPDFPRLDGCACPSRYPLPVSHKPPCQWAMS